MRTRLLLPFVLLFPALPAQTPAVPAVPAAPAAPAVPAAVMRSAGIGQVTRVLFDRQREGEPLWALGAGWKAAFDGRGFTAIPFFGSDAPRNFPVRFELAHASVGGEPLTLADGESVRDGNRVRTARGACTEVVDTALDRLEQSFVFDALPRRGAIAVDVRIDGDLAVTADDAGLHFQNQYGRFDYAGAVAVDAAGQRLPLTIGWNGREAHLEIPADFVAKAQLPIVLDPWLNYWYQLGSGQTVLQHDSDVASFQAAGGRTLIVYQRNFSATDTDCYGILFDGGLGLVQTDFALDFSTNNWTRVAVAANNYAQNFLLVAQVTTPLTAYIVGRTVDGAAATGAVFDIERDGVVGLPGADYLPDVGSDPYFGAGRYTVIFVKRPPGAAYTTDVLFKQVTPAGALASLTPTLLESWPSGVTQPSISKSCGQANGQPQHWLLTWMRTYNQPPYDHEIYGRMVHWNGAVIGSFNFGIAVTVADETAPAAGSPIDAGGARYWPLVYDAASTAGQPRTVLCRLLDGNGNTQASFTVNSPGADNHDAQVDSDGTRFVITRTIEAVGQPSTVQAVTVAYLQPTNTFRYDEISDLATTAGSPYSQTNLCADFSGGNAPSARYFVCCSERATNTFRLVNYGGWQPGNPFTTRPTQCGTTTMSITGLPVIRQTLTFNVAPGPLAGVHLGFPDNIPLAPFGCNCTQGVNPVVTNFAPWSWMIPNDVSAVGLTLAAQGFHLTGTRCMGFVDLSDTAEFTIR